MTITRIPPQNLQLERSILATMLTDADACDDALEILRDDSFYSSAENTVYRAIKALRLAGSPVDLLTVDSHLKAAGSPAEAENLAEYIASSCASFANIEHHCRALNDLAVLRGVITAGNDMMSAAYAPDADARDVLDGAGERVFALAERRQTRPMESFRELLPKAFDRIEKYQTGKCDGIVKTGFERLDTQTGGFNPSDLIIVAGRPGMGKTAFAMAIAMHAAKTCTPVAVFSMEMSKAQLVERTLCSEGQVESVRLRSGSIARRELNNLGIAAGPLFELPVYIDDTPGLNILDLRTKARRARQKYGIGLIAIDYLQLMGSVKRGENRQNEISEISRQLKCIAKEMSVPVIALSQLSRAPEQRSDHRPTLADLRESGSIEQDADIVLFLYRDWLYTQDDKTKNLCDIIIGKQRNGPICTVKVSFVPEFAKFGNLTTKEKEIPHDGDF